VKVGELQVGDLVILPFPNGFSSYLILEVRRRKCGRLDLRFFTIGRSGPDEWSEVAWSLEAPEEDFARNAVLLRRPSPTDEE